MRSLVALAVLLLVVFAASAAVARAGARSWERPVAGPVLRPFAVGADRFAAGQHRGVDLGAPRGARVRAACGGRVTFAGWVPGGGPTVSVRCGELVATYQRLGVIAVRRGERVARGRRLGTVGGASGAPHVHLGARDAATGRYVDPLALLGAAHGPPPAPLPPVGAPGRSPPPLLPSAPARPLPGARPAPAPALPWIVWLGLGCVGLGLPLGALVHVRGRWRRRSAASVVVTARS